MSQELLKKAAQGSMKDNVTDFKIGDTVGVSVRIVEGEKERIQVFSGVVIARSGSGPSETFTVRRIVANQGVERVFPVHSPRVADIEVTRSGKTRRAKLYYLRKRVGKATRLQDTASRKRPGRSRGAVAETARAQQATAQAAQAQPAEAADPSGPAEE